MGLSTACLTCRVCGAPVARGTGRTPKELHPRCKDFLNFLAAAGRAVREIAWYETTASRTARKKARGDLFALANLMPVNWHSLRDQYGRFRAATNAGRGPKPRVQSEKGGAI